MMEVSGGGGEPQHTENDNSRSHPLPQPPPPSQPFSRDYSHTAEIPPLSIPTKKTPSSWHQLQTSTILTPSMDFAYSVSTGQSDIKEPESPDQKVYDEQGRNILHVPSYHSEMSDRSSHYNRGDQSPGLLDGQFSIAREGQPDTGDTSVVRYKQELTPEAEGMEECPPCNTKIERPSSPTEYSPQTIVPKIETWSAYSADTSSPDQGMCGQSSHLSPDRAAEINPNMFNAFSSKVLSRFTDFSKVHDHFTTSPHLSSCDLSNHNSAHDTVVPNNTQLNTQVTKENVDQQRLLDSELREQLEVLPSQAEKIPPQETLRPSSPVGSKNTNPTPQNKPFVVTPSLYCDSDTDEYTEADYKPILENLAAKNAQSSSSTEKQMKTVKKGRRAVRKCQRNKVFLKEEPAGEKSSGSEYVPISCGKTVVAKEKTPERLQPVRQKRQSVTSSFADYYEESDDSIPDRPQRTKRAARKNVQKHDADSKTYQPKKLDNGRPANKHGKGYSKGPRNRTCPECNKTFTRAGSLTIHLRVHTGDRPFHCQECDATYKVSSHLRNHIRSKHSDIKAYQCENCSKAFSTSNVKRRHEKTCGTDMSDRVKHQCPRCQKRFVTEEGYERHKNQESCNLGEMSLYAGDDDQNIDNAGEVSTKHEGKTFKCTVCPKAFAESIGLETHQQFLCGKAPGAGPYTCSQCNKEFLRWNRFVGHCRRHTGDKPHHCSHCGSRFFDKDSLRKHVSRHKGKTSVKCSLCEKQFNVKRTLAMHIMRVHCGMKPYKCNECDSDFASAKLLSTHIRRVHRKEKRFKCQICGRAFFESQAWMKHMILHAGDRPPRIRGPVHKYPCNLCGKSFNMRLMRMHVEEDHPGSALSEAVSKVMVTCKLCKKEFSDPSSLKMHMIRHSGRKDFKCDKCEMYFITPAAMQLHQRKHSDDRPYACEDCGQTFRWRASLRDHKMHLHNPNLEPPDANGRRFGCKECGQRFKRYNTLRTHMIRHRGVMPCICSECGKGFTDNTRLKIHMSCHTGSDRPFICETCGAGFYYSFLLKRHIQSRHNPSPWLCNMCGRSLCSKDALKRHIQHHANSPDGKVRVGGNRGRPRKYRDPNELVDEAPKTKEPVEEKIKGKRGRKSKKTTESLKQMEDKAVYQNVLRDEVRNVMEPSNSLESRDIMEQQGNLVVESRDAMEHIHKIEPGNTLEPRHTVENRIPVVESRTVMDSRPLNNRSSVVESGSVMDSRPLNNRISVVESRSVIDSRPLNNSSVDSRIVIEHRHMFEHRRLLEPKNMIDTRIMMESRNMMMEPRNTIESGNSMEPRKNALEPLNASFETRTLMEPRNNLEPRNSVEPRNTFEPVLETSKELPLPPSGGTYVELTRASGMQINSHMYAQQNFGYPPANYMNPLLWPKTEEH